MNCSGLQKLKGWIAMKNNQEKNKDLAEKMRAAYPNVDERTSVVSRDGMAACGVISIFYVFITIIYVGFNGGLALPELVLLFVMLFAINRVNYRNRVFPLPSIYGKAVDPAPAAKGKRIGLYALNSLPLAVSWALYDTITNITGQSNVPLQIITDFSLMFIVAFIIDTILNEAKVKKYNNNLNMLEKEENDLSDD